MSSTKVVLNLALILALLLGLGSAQAQVIPLKVEFPADGMVNVGQIIEISNGSNTLLGDKELSNIMFDGVQITVAGYGLLATTGSIVANGTIAGETQGMTDVVKTNSSGNFHISFRVPELAYGNHTITIGGRQINVKILGRIVSATPFSVKIDGNITVTGNGFTANQKVDIKLSGIKQFQVVANASGSFTVTSAVVEAPYGLNNMQAADLKHTSNVAESVNVIFVNPLIKAFSGGNQTVGKELTVKARGLPANGGVSVVVGSVAATITSGGTVNSKGTIETKYKIPHLNSGGKALKVQVGSVSVSQGGAHTIVPAITGISPSHGTLGTSVTITGTGYGINTVPNPDVGEDVQVTVNGINVGNVAGGRASISSGTAGDLSVTISMPDLAQGGDVPVVVRGKTSTLQAQTIFLYSIPASADRTLRINKATAAVGDTITAEGFNYPPNTVVGQLIIKQGTSSFTSVSNDVTTGPDGYFKQNFTVPLKPAGSGGVALNYVVDTSGANLQADLGNRTFTISPKVTSVGPTSVEVNRQAVTVSANGFYKDENVKFIVGASSKTVKANANGEASASFKLGAQPYGSKTVRAEAAADPGRGHTSGTKVKVNNRVYDVKVNGAGSKNGTSVNVGDAVDVLGNGWDAGVPVEVKFGGVVVANVATNGSGDLAATFAVPNMGDTGTYTISVKSKAGGKDATETTLDRGGAGLALTIRSKDATPIASATKSGFVGDTVTVKGTQLSANKNFGKITFDGANMDINGDGKIDGNDDVKSDGSGNFTKQFKVPAKQAGPYNIVLGGSTVGFTVKGKITSVTTGNKHVGDEITVKVTGYPAGAPTVTLSGVGVNIGGSTVGGNGSGTIKFNIPAGTAASTAGLKKVKVVSGGTSVEANGPSVVPKITLNPTTGTIGDAIQITGNGFTANERVTAAFDGVDQNEERADQFGQVAIGINAPGRPIGARTVTATGNVSNLSASATWQMQPSADLTPASGTNDTVVTISGNGMSPNEQLDLDIVSKVTDSNEDDTISTVQSGSLTADAAGTFNFSIKIGVDTNKLTYGTKNFIVRGLTSGREIAMVFNVVGRVTSISPTSGPAGTMITVTGDGYGKSEKLTIDIGGAASAPKDNPSIGSDGSFSVQIAAPAGQAYGDKTVKVTGNTGGESHNASAKFGMRGRIYKVEINGSKDKNKKLHIGDNVTVYADGLSTSGGKLNVSIGGVKYIDGGTTGDGTIDAAETFAVGDRGYATGMSVVVQDNKQTLTASGPRNDNGVGALDIGPQLITVERADAPGVQSGPIGSRVRVVGNGFRTSQTIVNILVNGVVRATTSSDNKGRVGVVAQGEAIIPVGTPLGQATIQVTDGVASASSTVFIVTGSAGPTLRYTDGSTSKSAKWGDKLTMVGEGFAPGTNITGVTVGGVSAAINAVQTVDAEGAFRITFSVPEVVEGNRTVDTVGQGATSKVKVNVLNKVVVTDADNKYFIGERINFKATGLKSDATLTITLQEVAGGHSVTRVKDDNTNLNLVPDTSVKDANGNDIGFKSDANGTLTGWLKVPTFPESPSNYNLIIRNASTGIELKGQITSPTAKQQRYNGDTFRVQGNGFRAGELVQVSFGSQSVSANANADGVFDTGNQTLSNQEQGDKKITVVGTASGEEIKNVVLLDILPKIQLTGATSGTVGTSVSVSGTGFEGGKEVKVVVRHPAGAVGDKEVLKFNADGSGNFAKSFAMPTRPGGVNTVIGRDSTSGREYSLPFVVTGRITEVKESTRAVGSSQTIKVDGVGANQPINLEMGPTGGSRFVVGGVGNANADGTATIAFAVPSQQAGLKDVYISTQSAATPVKTGAFTVVPGNIVMTSQTSGNPISAGGPNTTINVTGNGFLANSVVQVNFGGVVAVTTPVDAKTNGKGEYTASFQVPALPSSGVKTVIFATGSFQTSATFVYSLAGSGAELQIISGGSTNVGGAVKVRGFGYLSGVNVGNIAYKNSGANDDAFATGVLNVTRIGTGGWDVVGNEIITDQHGIFEVQFNVPALTGGVKILDTRRVGHNAVHRAEFTLNSKIVLTPDNAPRGTAGIQVTATGFGASSILGKVDYAGRSLKVYGATLGSIDADRAKTNGSGSFTGLFDIPGTGGGTSAGKHTVTLGGASATYRVTGNGEIYSPSTTAAPVGSAVSFNARGFVANETVKIYLGADQIGSATANGNGEFSFGFNVPVRAFGTYALKAKGTQKSDNPAVQTSQINFDVTGRITALVPSEGTKGTSVTVTGNGFAANEALTLDFGTTLAYVGGNARSDGTFAITFTVPDYPYGNATIKVTGATSAQSKTATFKVKSKIGVTPDKGIVAVDAAGNLNPGGSTAVTVTGSGFDPANVTLDVYIGSQKVAGVPINANGSFSTGPVNLNTKQTYGAKDVKADAANNSTDVTKGGSFTIQPFVIAGKAGAPINAGVYGEALDVYWTGYTSGAANVFIANVLATSGGNVDTANDGSGHKTVKVPGVPIGNTKLRVTDTSGSPSKEIDFTVNQTSTTVRDITITDDAGSGTDSKGYVGTLVTVSGHGFGKANGSDELVNVEFQRIPGDANSFVIMHQVMTSGGSFSTSGFQVPTVPGGVHQVRVTGLSSSVENPPKPAIVKNFTELPHITSFPGAARPGDTVSVTGNGAADTETFADVILKTLEGKPFAGPSAEISLGANTFTSAADGTFVMNVTVPNVVYSDDDGNGRIPTQIKVDGAQDIGFTAFLNIALTTAAPEYTIQVVSPAPDATTGVASGPADTRITIRGTAKDGAGLPLRNTDIGNVRLSAQNLPPTNVTVAANTLVKSKGALVGDKIRTDDNGDYEVSFNLKNASGFTLVGGNATIQVQTASTGFNVQGRVAATPATVVPGNAIALNGFGYFGNVPISFKFGPVGAETDAVTTPASVVTDVNGTFQNVTINVPAGTAGGQYRVIALGPADDVTKAPTLAAAVSVVGQLTAPTAAAPASAQVGGELTATGFGLGASEAMTIQVGGVTVPAEDIVSGGTTNADGTFAVTLKVPVLPGGLHSLNITGTTSGVVVGEANAVSIAFGAAVAPNTGSVGVEVTFSGQGFAPDEAVTIDFGVLTDVVPGTMADGAGSFSVKYIVDQVQTGDVAVKVTGATSGTVNLVFTYEDTVGPVVASVEENSAGATLKPGDTITVTVKQRDAFDTAASGSASIGEKISISLSLVANGADPATWTGTYTVQAGDLAKALPVEAMLTDATGNEGASVASATTVTIDALAEVTSVVVNPTTPARVGASITIVATGDAGGTATFTIPGIEAATKVAMVENPAGTYTGSYAIAAENMAKTKVTVDLVDALGNTGSGQSEEMVNIDTKSVVSNPAASPATVRNGQDLTITVTAEAGSTVTADVSAVDTTQTDPVALTAGEDGVTYSATITIAAGSEAPNGKQVVTITAVDAAKNTAVVTVEVEVKNATSFTIALGGGLNFIHVPVADPDISTVADVYKAIKDAGGDVLLVIYYDTNSKSFQSYSEPFNKPSDPVNVTLQPDTGLIAVMRPGTAKKVTFEGPAYAQNTVGLKTGLNLVGLPTDAGLTKLSELAALDSNMSLITGQATEGLKSYPPVDLDITGGQSFLVAATADTVVDLAAAGPTAPWENDAALLATPSVVARLLDSNQTGAFVVEGYVALDTTEMLLDNMNVTVRNLYTNATLDDTTGTLAGEGKFSVAFVDTDGRAVAVDDTLEVSIADPNGRFGTEPFRHVVTRDDILSGRLLIDVRMAEIPEESALLANYPNPFNPETWIPFHLAEGTEVRLNIFDASGRLVRMLDLGYKSAGMYESRAKAAYWDGRNAQGERVASGIYFYRLQAGDFTALRKMLVLK